MPIRQVDTMLQHYGTSHQNPTNRVLHNFCVPAIMLSLIMLLWEIPVPEGLRAIPWANFATLFCIVVSIYYLKLSVRLAAAMALQVSVALFICYLCEQNGISLLQTAAIIFALAWILQFIGHYIEGKKPSLFEDLRYLLIGPLWVCAKVFQRFGVRY